MTMINKSAHPFLSKTNVESNHPQFIHEIEEIDFGENGFELKGYCFIEHKNVALIQQIQFILYDELHKTEYLIPHKNEFKREDLSYLYDEYNQYHYQLSGFHLDVSFNDLQKQRKLKQLKVFVYLKFEETEYLEQLSNVQDTLEKIIVPDYLILKSAAQKKSPQKHQRGWKYSIYKKTKKFYKKIPSKYKHQKVNQFLVKCKKRFI
ncbi:hypothetical protein [Alkalihalobacillus sp. 1P02AB]|uniref:hypothetical protein n=1 Tax=Alkalihalobacillus sp. 1P02AB TaxID=3132260 RepID=UPI0039A4D993